MSRNQNGVYFLPDGNPVAAGELITAEWANNTLSDMATALTDSLDRDGLGGMRGSLRIADGTASAPGMAFTNDPNTGICRKGDGIVAVSTKGSVVAEVSTNGISMVGNAQVFVQPAPSGVTAVTNKQYVDTTINGAIANISNKLAIVGEIRMFTAAAVLPSGWHVCDGTSGTVDLRDKFPLASGSVFAKGTTGGSLKISTAQMPSHAHGGSVNGNTGNESVGHTHAFDSQTGAMSKNQGHTHAVSDPGHIHQETSTNQIGTNGGAYTSGTSSGNQAPSAFTTLSSATYIGIAEANIDHSHSVAGNTAGVSADHTHPFTAPITAEGGGQDYVQPYYALVFAQFTGV